jgi:hypothetical protein
VLLVIITAQLPSAPHQISTGEQLTSSAVVRFSCILGGHHRFLDRLISLKTFDFCLIKNQRKSKIIKEKSNNRISLQNRSYFVTADQRVGGGFIVL